MVVAAALPRHCARRLVHQVRYNLTHTRWHGGPAAAPDAATVQISFRNNDGTLRTVEAREGETLLQTAHRFDIGLEGACEGGTCVNHLVDVTF